VVSKNCDIRKMVSFEANPNLIPHINDLYALNDLTERNSVVNALLISDPDRPDTLPFHIGRSYLGSSLLDTAAHSKETVSIETMAYSDLHADLKPDVILMDIEGGELAFLEHANLEGVRAIVAEFHPKAYEVAGMRRCKSILRDAGFEPLADFSTRTVWVATREL